MRAGLIVNLMMDKVTECQVPINYSSWKERCLKFDVKSRQWVRGQALVVATPSWGHRPETRFVPRTGIAHASS